MTTGDHDSEPRRARDAKDSSFRAETPQVPSCALLEKIFDTTEFLVAFLDPELRFIRVNRGYAQAARRPIASFAGKKHFELFPDE